MTKQITSSGNRIEEVTLRKAVGWNNGKPGGEEYWIVYLGGDKKRPLLNGTLSAVLDWLGETL